MWCFTAWIDLIGSPCGKTKRPILEHAASRLQASARSVATVALGADVREGSRAGSMQVRLAPRTGVRVGMSLVINQGGASDEYHTVRGLTTSGVIIDGFLQHDHNAGEKVFLVLAGGAQVWSTEEAHSLKTTVL